MQVSCVPALSDAGRHVFLLADKPSLSDKMRPPFVASQYLLLATVIYPLN